MNVVVMDVSGSQCLVNSVKFLAVSGSRLSVTMVTLCR